MLTTPASSIEFGMLHIKDRLQALHPTIEKILAVSGTAGASIGVVHKGQVLHTDHFGFRDHARQNAPDSDTIYVVGSLTKAMIAQAFGSLVEENILKWNTVVADIVPEFRSSDRCLTEMCDVSDLLSHRSGIPTFNVLWYQGGSKSLVRKEDLIPMVNGMVPTVPFRKSWVYSNWGYALAAEVIQRATGEPWHALLKRKFWEPLGMNRTSSSQTWRELPNVAEGFSALPDASLFPVLTQTVDDSTIMGAAGGVCSSLNDLLIYYGSLLDATSQQLANGTTSSRGSLFKQLETIFSGHAVLNPSPYGIFSDTMYTLGWVRVQLPTQLGVLADNPGNVSKMPIVAPGAKPQHAFYHQGSLSGAYTCVILLPETRSCILVLVNTKALGDSADWIAQLLTETLLDSPEKNDYLKFATESAEGARRRYESASKSLQKTRVPGTPHKPLNQYCGRYHWTCPSYFIDIVHHDGTLRLIIQGRPDQVYKLSHYNFDTFTWLLTDEEEAKRGRFTQSDEAYKMVFVSNELHQIDSFVWQQMGGGKGTFTKSTESPILPVL